MAFTVLKLFPTFVSIKIRFGFNDVTHIFGGPLRTRITSLKNNRVKYLTSNLWRHVFILNGYQYQEELRSTSLKSFIA